MAGRLKVLALRRAPAYIEANNLIRSTHSQKACICRLFCFLALMQ
jgi:hypothetical protein